jgi:hypothetical protein
MLIQSYVPSMIMMLIFGNTKVNKQWSAKNKNNNTLYIHFISIYTGVFEIIFHINCLKKQKECW